MSKTKRTMNASRASVAILEKRVENVELSTSYLKSNYSNYVGPLVVIVNKMAMQIEALDNRVQLVQKEFLDYKEKQSKEMSQLVQNVILNKIKQDLIESNKSANKPEPLIVPESDVNPENDYFRKDMEEMVEKYCKSF